MIPGEVFRPDEAVRVCSTSPPKESERMKIGTRLNKRVEEIERNLFFNVFILERRRVLCN